MRRVKAETVGCMSGLTRVDQVLTAHFRFPEEYIGFQGHFPAQKVLPGVCQIHCVLAVIEAGEGVMVTLRELLLAKYAAPVRPGEELVCTVQPVAAADGSTVFKAQLTAQGKKVTEMKLSVILAKETD